MYELANVNWWAELSGATDCRPSAPSPVVSIGTPPAVVAVGFATISLPMWFSKIEAR